ncbi:LacI family transcriptional regulator [Aquitalea magnusonii]|nr:LacI family transcriptional regulator [Aquitalea magnusonii]
MATLALPVWYCTRAWASGRTPQIAMVLKSMRNEFFQAMAEGARRHAVQNEGRYRLLLEGITVETDYQRQQEIIKNLLARQIDALIVVPSDSVAMIPPLLKAVQSKTLVVTLDNKLDDRELAGKGVNIPFVGPSNFAGARAAGEYIAGLLPIHSEVGIIEGPSAHINAKARSDGYRMAMFNKSMQVSGVQSGYWEIEGGQQAATALMKKSPGIRALLCGNDNMAIGASKAVDALGLKDKVLICGYDNIPAVRPYMTAGKIQATIDQHPDKQAEYALDLALRALQNHILQDDLPAIVQTPFQLVSKV